MLVANPIRESYKEIREKYDGYCVLVTECERKKMDFGTGKVIAYHEDLAALTEATLELTDEDLGIFAYRTFSDMGSLSPIQVVHYD